MEGGREDLVGEVGDSGGEVTENAGDVARTVAVGDGGTASLTGSSSWLKRKIWLRGRDRRLDKVFFPREATDWVVGPAFSSPLGGGLGMVWAGAGCLREDFPTFLMDRNAWDARARKVLDLDIGSFFPETEGIFFPTL